LPRRDEEPPAALASPSFYGRNPRAASLQTPAQPSRKRFASIAVLSHAAPSVKQFEALAKLKFLFRPADKVNMQERRTEVRMLCADMLEVCWKDQTGREKTGTGLLEDISPSGACLQMEAPIPLGSAIRWQAAGHDFSGSVRYCVYREIGYFVGVEFVADSRWSKKAYRPQHLLDLKKLLG
jgi:hypothetical protein